MRSRPAGGLHAALSFFTWVPVPAVEVDAGVARRAIAALPWVGLGMGVVAGVVAGVVGWLAASAGGETGAGTRPALGGRSDATGLLGGQGLVPSDLPVHGLLAAVVALAIVAVLSGAMHLDGLADTADGLGSRAPAGRALEIMRQSDIGPMGVTALVFVLALDAASLASPRFGLAELLVAVVTFPMVGRVAAVGGTARSVPSARGSGFGALFAGVTPVSSLVGTGLAAMGVACGLAWLLAGWMAVIVVAVAALASWAVASLWARHLVRRLGGLTGDTLGSLIEVTQTSYLLLLAVAL